MHDRDVRAAVRRILAHAHEHDPDTLVVEEMGVWQSSVRIDLAVINGELSGFELKSDKDTLGRLPLQADIYSRVFDRVTLVAGTRHIAKAVGMVPGWWGVVQASIADDVVVLEEIRASTENPQQDPRLVAALLWKQEAVDILDTYGLAKGWRARRIGDIHARLAEELPLELLGAAVRQTLKRRIGWLGQNRAN